MNKYLLAALPAIALLLAIGVAHAATITSNNANDLNYIIYYTNTSVNISTSGDKIALVNTDANHSALVVFNPALAIAVHDVANASIALVNITSYNVIEILDASTAGYAGKSVDPSLALALIIPANTTATLTSIYYEAGGAEELNAPTPPQGYKLVEAKQGKGNSAWKWSASKGSVWVAFWSDSYTSLLEITTPNGDNVELISEPSKFVSKIFNMENGQLTFKVFTESNSEWEVLWAYKPDPGMEPQPTKTPEPSKTARPSAEIPSNNDKKLEYAAAGLAFLLILFMAISLTGRRR